MKRAVITKEQHREIYGKQYGPISYFNPTLDPDGNIFISEVEVTQMDKQLYPWANDLVLKEKEEILKDLSPEQWLEVDKAEYEKLAMELDVRIKKGK